MRTRLIVGGLIVGVAAWAGPALASSTGPVPPACVVVTGPSGANIQVGYAPNGPGDCTALP